MCFDVELAPGVWRPVWTRINSEQVFLAYEINGVPLPQKHGFPLRLVAEDHYGARWVKYVDRITAVAP